MRGYTQLTQEERYQIYTLKKAGHSQTEIATLLERDKSTISRELQPQEARLRTSAGGTGRRRGGVRRVCT